MQSRFPHGAEITTRATALVALALLALLGAAVVSLWLRDTLPPWMVATGAGSGGARVQGESVPPSEIYRRSIGGVVKIVAFDTRSGGYATAPGEAGSGFVVDADGRIVTCAHVVSPDGAPVSRVRVEFRTGEVGKRSVEGSVLGVDAAADLAVVRVDPEAADLIVLPLGDSDGLEVGDSVFSLGNALDYDFSMTGGIVSALHRVILGPDDATIRDGIQTDAAVNVGDSGGPLLDANGAVIGVNEQIATPDGIPTGNVGVAFAVPVATVRDVLEQLRSSGTIVRPWIGVEALTITPSAVQVLGLKVARGFVLVDVTADGPAAVAGLRGGDRVVAVPGQPGRTVAAGGDVVTALAGRPVSSTDDLVICVQALKPGDRLPVTYLRDGRTMTTVIMVGVRPSP